MRAAARDPFDQDEAVRQSEAEFEKVKVPTYTGSGWYGYIYKTHLNGAQSWFEEISAPKKLMFTGPAHLERPFHSFHHEILRWYDYWLKGLDTARIFHDVRRPSHLLLPVIPTP